MDALTTLLLLSPKPAESSAPAKSEILLENGNGILLEDGSGVFLMES